jgi:hypothetical protein
MNPPLKNYNEYFSEIKSSIVFVDVVTQIIN